MNFKPFGTLGFVASRITFQGKATDNPRYVVVEAKDEHDQWQGYLGRNGERLNRPEFLPSPERDPLALGRAFLLAASAKDADVQLYSEEFATALADLSGRQTWHVGLAEVRHYLNARRVQSYVEPPLFGPSNREIRTTPPNQVFKFSLASCNAAKAVDISTEILDELDLTPRQTRALVKALSEGITAFAEHHDQLSVAAYRIAEWAAAELAMNPHGERGFTPMRFREADAKFEFGHGIDH